jgi:transcriptional regulator with XRE-family HTH domain
MKRRAGDRFKFKPQLGARLRELRLKAGFTQQMLAVAMGSQRIGNHAVVSRLERGKMKNPGIGFVADYLRACRAGFADVLSVLDPYTSQPTVVEVETEKAVAKVREFLPAKIDRAMERYDRGIRRPAEAGHAPQPEPAERVRRVRSFALSQVWAKRVRRCVIDIIGMQHLGLGLGNEQHLQNYAARVWSVLSRTRGKRAGRRTALLEAAARPRRGEEVVKPEQQRAVRAGLLELFQQAEMAGQLDVATQFEPGEEQPRQLLQPKPDRRPERDAWDKARAVLVEELWQEMSRMPELAGLDPRRMPLYLSVVRGLCSIVDHQAPESDECRRQVEALATDEYCTSRGRDPALVRRLAAVVIPRWEELRQSLVPHPCGFATVGTNGRVRPAVAT